MSRRDAVAVLADCFAGPFRPEWVGVGQRMFFLLTRGCPSGDRVASVDPHEGPGTRGHAAE